MCAHFFLPAHLPQITCSEIILGGGFAVLMPTRQKHKQNTEIEMAHAISFEQTLDCTSSGYLQEQDSNRTGSSCLREVDNSAFWI